MRADIDRPHLSWSQVSLFQRCPRRYYYQYIERLPMRPVYALASGKAMHAGLEQHHLELVRGVGGLSSEAIVDCAVAHFEGQEDVGELEIAKGKATDLLVKEIAPPVCHYVNFTEREELGREVPVAEDDVEREIWFEVAGEPFVGYVDLVLPSTVLDYKLLGRRKTAQDVERDGQGVLYRRALGKPFAFVQCLRGKEVSELTQQVTAEHVERGIYAAIEDAVRSIAVAKQTGHFPRCDPKSWACSEKWCPFFRKCYPYGGK